MHAQACDDSRDGFVDSSAAEQHFGFRERSVCFDLNLHESSFLGESIDPPTEKGERAPRRCIQALLKCKRMDGKEVVFARHRSG